MEAGRDSPVRADSSACRLVLSIRRMSAGTWQPASRLTKSPTTRVYASTSCRTPSRMTNALGLTSFFKESRARWALPSWIMPTTALSTTTTPMMMASLVSSSSTEMTAAASST